MRWLWMAIGALVAAGPAYLTGDLVGGREAAATAEAHAQTIAAQAQRDAAHRDLAAAHAAAERAQAAEAESREAVQHAREQIDDYEAELARRGADARCALSPDDVRRMRLYDPRASPAKPAAR